MNFKDKEAIYLQIADYVCDNIILGKWLPDEKVPSVRDLAVSMEVNPNTVTRSYDYLQQQQIVANRRGLGQFVTTDALERIKDIRREKFMQQEVPDFFTTMYLLEIEPEEILERYDDFLNNLHSNNS